MNDLTVNSLGEIYRGDECLVSSVNVNTVASQALSQADQKRWERGGHATRKGEGPLGNEMALAIAAELNRQKKESLSPSELVFVDKVDRLAEINNDQFRVYGYMKHGHPTVKLVTEFISFTDAAGQPVFKAVKQKAKETGAKVEVMSKDKHLDHYGITVNGPGQSVAYVLARFKSEGRRLQNNGKPDAQGIIWSFGPNHGRPETQVELSWNVRGLTMPQLRAKIKGLVKVFDTLWPISGVSVI